MQLTVLLVDGLFVSLSSVMFALHSSFPCCNCSTKNTVRPLSWPCPAGFSARTVKRHGIRRSIVTSGAAQFSQATSDQRMTEKLQEFTIKSLPCNLVKLYNDTVTSKQEAWLGVVSCTGTDTDSMAQSPAAAPKSIEETVALQIISFGMVVMHDLLPRLKLHAQQTPVKTQVIEDLTTLLEMMFELQPQVCGDTSHTVKRQMWPTCRVAPY